MGLSQVSQPPRIERVHPIHNANPQLTTIMLDMHTAAHRSSLSNAHSAYVLAIRMTRSHEFVPRGDYLMNPGRTFGYQSSSQIAIYECDGEKGQGVRMAKGRRTGQDFK